MQKLRTKGGREGEPAGVLRSSSQQSHAPIVDNKKQEEGNKIMQMKHEGFKGRVGRKGTL